MPKTKAIISIENVVATGSLDQTMDLKLITRKFPDTEYNPVRFPGLVFRIKSPKTATLIFHSGKMVCTGAKSEELASKAINTVVQKLKGSGIEIVSNPIVQVQNIVASINLGGRIHLEEAARQLPRTIYEPEQFPGAMVRVPDPKVVFLLFSSGKLVCTGGKTEADVHRAVNDLHNTLEEKNLMIY